MAINTNKKRKKLYAGRDDIASRHRFYTNKLSEELAQKATKILETLTGIEVSSTVLFRRAIYSLVMELTEITKKLGQSENWVEALSDEKEKQIGLLVLMASREPSANTGHKDK